jgi:hypothetical protein
MLVAKPRDGNIGFREIRGQQQGVMGTFLETYHNRVLRDGNLRGGRK